MALKVLDRSETLEIAKTINSYSTFLPWMTDEPYILDDIEPRYDYLPSTSLTLGFAVIPMMVESDFISHLKQKYGADASVMSFINTQASLAEEKGYDLQIDWTLRFFKEKKLFKTIYAIQSNLMPGIGNTGITLGNYEGRKPADPIHQMFSELS